MTNGTNELDMIRAGVALQAQGEGARFGAQEFYDLLALRAFQYTMGESASLSEGTAKELLRGLCFCQGVCAPKEGESLAVVVERGSLEIRRRVKRARLLFAAAKTRLPGAINASYAETLDAIGEFFGNYDELYFPHAIPCDITYPLCRPVDEALEGIDFISAYLRELGLECDFLRRFAPFDAAELYSRAMDGYYELIFNLYAPVAEAALGRTLLQMSPEALVLDDMDRARLIRALAPLGEDELCARLDEAAGRLCTYFDMEGESTALLRHAARAMEKRLRAALASGDIAGVFPKARESAPEEDYIDFGVPMEDGALRRFIEEVRSCRYASDKFAMIRRDVKSVADIYEIINAGLTDEESDAFIASLNEEERELLRRYAR